MLKRHNQNEREAALRRYFEKQPTKDSEEMAMAIIAGGVLFTLAAIIMFFSQRDSAGAGCFAALSLIAGLTLGCVGYIKVSSIESRYQNALRAILPQPLDEQVDRWFEESLQRLILHSRLALRLTESEGQFAEPLVLSAPTLSKTHGIPSEDLKWKKGKDNRLRFAIYNIIVIYLTERHLAAFTCDFNFLRDVSLNETSREYHYQDIVSVTTYEWSEAFDRPTCEKRITSQIFRLSVASGEFIEVREDCSVLRQMTKEEQVPAMGADEKVATIRAMLRVKKA